MLENKLLFFTFSLPFRLTRIILETEARNYTIYMVSSYRYYMD